jgi:hypothetical protein
MNLVALVGLSSPELLRSFSRPTIIAVIQVNQSRSEISIPNLANWAFPPSSAVNT